MVQESGKESLCVLDFRKTTRLTLKHLSSMYSNVLVVAYILGYFDVPSIHGRGGGLGGV